jgi:hypothetical protein
VPRSRTLSTAGRRRSRVLLATALGTVGVFVLSTASSATHDFPDVPASSPFHDEISWMADTGITTGYPDGTFRPTEPLTRQAMSAFMQRLYNLRDDVAVDSAPDLADFDAPIFTPIPGLSTQVTVPPGTTATVIARFGAESHCEDDDNTGWCSVRILLDGAEMTPTAGVALVFDTPTTGSASDWWESNMIEHWTLEVPPGVHTVTVEGAEGNGGVDTFWLAEMTLVAQAILDPVP